MILVFTDFGEQCSYTGELRAMLARCAPEAAVVSLATDAPAFRPDLAAYLLAAVAATAQRGDVVLAVVDPGVGGARRALALEVDGRWLVGPDNGLFELVLRRAGHWSGYEILWRPARLSASFHGRDLFAPMAARLARGDRLGLAPAEPTRWLAWPDDLPAIVAIDRFGNAITGLRADRAPSAAMLATAGRRLRRSRTFSDVPLGEAFWYENSNGLVEIAANGRSAAELLALAVGMPAGFAD